VTRTADRLVALARELGADVSVRVAQTGTVYLAVSRGRRATTIRVADHADAYGRADYSCDGIEGSPAGARAHLLRALGTSPAALRRLRRLRRRAVRARAAAQREAWITGYARERGCSRAEAEREYPLAG
jgi:hypothetical protein